MLKRQSKRRIINPVPSPTRLPVPSDAKLPVDVGRTPMASLDVIIAAIGVLHPHLEVWGKCEMYNRGGSSKARAAFYLMEGVCSSGRIHRGQLIVLPSSGNTAISVATECARRGIPCHVFIPENAGPEKIDMVRYFGAKVIPTPAKLGSNGAYEAAKAYVETNPDRFFFLDQYAEEAAWRAHFETTGPEIWAQTCGQVTHVVIAVGTGGTIMGVGRYLKSRNPNVRVISVQPDGPAQWIPGLRYLGEDEWVPPIYDKTVVDEEVYVTLADAMHYASLCARTAGISIGPSSGAALAAAMRVCSGLKSGNVVVLFPDSMEKYASSLPALLASSVGRAQSENGDAK